jgi:hypothetical protein
MELEDNFFLLTAFLTHRAFLLSSSIPILQGGPLFRGKTSSTRYITGIKLVAGEDDFG